MKTTLLLPAAALALMLGACGSKTDDAAALNEGTVSAGENAAIEDVTGNELGNLLDDPYENQLVGDISQNQQ